MNDDDQALLRRNLLIASKDGAIDNMAARVEIEMMGQPEVAERTLDDDVQRIIAEVNALIPADGNDWRRREKLTAELLAESLCPLHRVDYAICFDDQNLECAAIRTIHPSHDS